ncbi:MAG: DNA/RNA nuclease SfsA [Planctomycetes bacterium]|nr:DNA/RNA nuclease SfsA [Planctomycetota bacterium]MCB9905013.1 DNA/RNA nuclease SfsA [Planctomycetota bacterium]
MKIEERLERGTLLRRYKRFLADVELADGAVETTHCPNPGRLIGCLPDRAEVVLRISANPKRKLAKTLQTIRVGDEWVNVDTLLPNPVVGEALRAGTIAELAGYAHVRAEVKSSDGTRIDFLLEDPARGRCWVEVKCTTLVEDRVAMFPDAVTARGKKHLEELTQLVAAGDRAVIFFFVSRADADRFAPAAHIDPAYAKALRAALDAGVEAIAYLAHVEPHELRLDRPIPIALP